MKNIKLILIAMVMSVTALEAQQNFANKSGRIFQSSFNAKVYTLKQFPVIDTNYVPAGIYLYNGDYIVNTIYTQVLIDSSWTVKYKFPTYHDSVTFKVHGFVQTYFTGINDTTLQLNAVTSIDTLTKFVKNIPWTLGFSFIISADSGGQISTTPTYKHAKLLNYKGSSCYYIHE